LLAWELRSCERISVLQVLVVIMVHVRAAAQRVSEVAFAIVMLGMVGIILVANTLREPAARAATAPHLADSTVDKPCDVSSRV
jgi:hypothetical protein